jgi:glutathione S-transferase
MKLYYMPGTCALAVHIALEWMGERYEDEEVERTHPNADLLPAVGTPQRYEAYRWVVYFGGTLHPHFWPYFGPGRYTTQAEHEPEVRAAAEVLIGKDFQLIERQLAGQRFVLGDRKTVADAYLFPMARWGYRLHQPTSAYPNIQRFVETMAADLGVRAAMARHRIGVPA